MLTALIALFDPFGVFPLLTNMVAETFSLPARIRMLDYEMKVQASVREFERVISDDYGPDGVANFAGCA